MKCKHKFPLLLLLISLIFVSCGQSSDTATNSDIKAQNEELQRQIDELKEIVDNTDENATAEPTTDTDDKEANAKKETTFKTIKYKNINFAVPTYFSEKGELYDGVDLHYFPKEKEEYASLMFSAEKVGNYNFNTYKKAFRKIWVSGKKDIIDERIVKLDGIKTYSVSFKEQDEEDGYIIASMILNDKKLIKVSLEVDNSESKYNYTDDYYEMLKRSKIISKKTSKKSEKTNGVDPKFKRAMDQYEKFFDKYIEFMKTFQESDDTAELMDEYAEYTKEYAETTKKLDKIKNQKLSKADEAYYVKVTTRINKKLLDVI